MTAFRILPVAAYTDFDRAILLIEAAVEDYEIKRKVKRGWYDYRESSR